MTVFAPGSVRPEAWPQGAARADASSFERRLGDAGGLTQYGVNWVELMPGATSSERHWHSAEDEFLLVLGGTPTLIDNDGEHLLAPGDAVCWRAGVPNAHHLANRTDLPCTWLVVGARVAEDICHYPDSGTTLINTLTDWKVVDAGGNVRRGGALPGWLTDLPARWGATDSPAPPSIVRKGAAEADAATPEQAAYMGAFTAQLLSRTGGLTQFGAFTETLSPGARSSDRHWHENEDEFLWMLAGEATVHEDDGPHPLSPGAFCCWKAGTANGHHVVNTSPGPCTYLVVGTRWPHDTVHYSEIDKIYRRSADGTVTRTRRDGSPLQATP